MGLKIGGLSLPKLSNINDVAELAIKANLPLNNLLVCTKLAESLFQGVLRKDAVNRQLDQATLKRSAPVLPNDFKPDSNSH